jgi:S1-C subfamily serine protease
MRALAIVCLGLLLACPAAAQDALPQETVDRLKAGTVFLKTSRGGRVLSVGSGFLVGRTETVGLVVTNAHVVAEARAGARLRAVFQSGSQEEWSCQARVLSRDSAHDLALVEVRGRQLPKPLPLTKTDAARETLPVYVVGYPLGDVLSSGARNPSPTLSRASIASFRQTPSGRVIQLDGELNPGNSGGPIVDAKGTLLGVAVAKIEGTNISFAIPVAQVSAFLRARLLDLSLEPTPKGVRVRARLVDPAGQVARVEVRLAEAKGQAPRSRAPISGRSAVFVAQGGQLRAEFELPEAASSYLVQTRVVLQDGSAEYSIPLALSLGRASKPQTTDSAPKASPPNTDAAGPSGITAITFPNLAEQIVPDPAGGGVFVILRDPQKPNAPATLILWDLARSAQVAKIAVPLAPTHMAVLEGKLVVVCAESQVVVVVDPKTRKIVKAGEVEAKRGNKDLPPLQVAEATLQGKAIVLCKSRLDDRRPVLALFDLESGEAELRGERTTERLTVSGKHLLYQDNFGGSPSGITTLFPHSELLDAPAPGQRPARAPRVNWKARSVGPLIPIPGGVAYSTLDGKTYAYSLDGSTDLWAATGVIFARSPRALYLSKTSTQAAAIIDWPIAAVDPRSGRVLWERTLRLPQASSPQIERSILTHYMPNVIVNAPWSMGAWAQSTTPWSLGEAVLATQAGVDRLVFPISEWSPTGTIGTRGVRFAEARRGWYSLVVKSIKAPKVDAKPLPTTLKSGETLSHAVVAEPTAGQRFVVIQGPDGLKVDPKTGLMTWTPGMAGLGKHAIKIGLASEGSEPKSVLEFVLRVRP